MSIGTVFSVVFLLICGCLASQAQDELSIGPVFTDSVFEGRIMRYVKNPEFQTIRSIEVKCPEFIKLKSVTTSIKRNDEDSTFQCSIGFDAVTSNPGSFQGELVILIGDCKHVVKVSLEVKPNIARGSRMLLLHSGLADISTELQWLRWAALENISADFLALSDHRMEGIRWQSYDLVIVSSDGLCSIDDDDVNYLNNFVVDGGRLYLEAHYCSRPSVDSVNRIITGYGLKMADIDGDVQHNVSGNSLITGTITNGVESLSLLRPSPMLMTSLAAFPEFFIQNEDGDGYLARARMGNGDIVVFGSAIRAVSPPRSAETLARNIVKYKRNSINKP